MKNIWFFLALAILAFAIFGTYGLVMKEYRVTNVCPKILGIPACYIVLACFVTALFGHFMGIKYLYFGFVGIVTLIASTGTLGEVFGFAKCPRTAGGIPMCFISLSICVSLLFFKYMQLRSMELIG